MKQFMTKKVLFIALVAVAILVGWYLYSKRWHKFSNNGDSQWLPATNKGRQSFMMNAKPSGLKANDPIKVFIDKTGETLDATVLEVLEPYNGAYWVVTDRGYKDYGGGQISGKLKKA